MAYGGKGWNDLVNSKKNGSAGQEWRREKDDAVGKLAGIRESLAERTV